MAARADAWAPGEVRVWWVDLDDARWDAVEPTPDERERAASFRSAEHARRFARGRAAARAVLASLAGAGAGHVRLDRTCARCGAQHGKPRAVAPAGAARLRFSASRAGGLMGLAVAVGHEVGLDLEHVSRVRDASLVAEHAFAPGERARLDALRDGPARDAAFLRAWTRKEAYLKLRGVGLAAPLDRVDTSAWREGAPVEDPLDPAEAPFAVVDVEAPPGHVAALALDAAPARVVAGAWPAPRHEA